MSKLPLNVKITPQKLDFLLEVTNQEFLSHNGGSTGRVIFKMAAAATILNFESGYHFITIEPIVTKFDWNVENLT